MNAQLKLPVCDPLQAAVDWRNANPLAYQALVEMAREDIAHGGRPAIDLYCHILRRPWWARRLGLHASDDVYLVNNNLTSQLSRLIAREYGLQFTQRASRYDEDAQ